MAFFEKKNIDEKKAQKILDRVNLIEENNSKRFKEIKDIKSELKNEVKGFPKKIDLEIARNLGIKIKKCEEEVSKNILKLSLNFDKIKKDLDNEKKIIFEDTDIRLGNILDNFNEEYEKKLNEVEKMKLDALKLINSYIVKLNSNVDKTDKKLLKLKKLEENIEEKFDTIFLKKEKELQRVFDDLVFSKVENLLDKQEKTFFENENLFKKNFDERIREFDVINKKNIDNFLYSINREKEDLDKRFDIVLDKKVTGLNDRFEKYFNDFKNEISVKNNEFNKVLKDEFSKTLSEVNGAMSDGFEKQNLNLVEKTKIQEKKINELENMIINLSNKIDDYESKSFSKNNEDMSNFILNFTNYENKLNSNIKLFLNKGLSKKEIYEILIQKGHPKLIIENFLN